MKKHTYIIALVILIGGLFVSCDATDAGLCFDNSEPTAERIVQVDAFDAIIVRDNVQLILSQGPQNIRVVTSKSIINKVVVGVKNGTLELIDENRCDLLVENEPTLIYVTAPNIKRVRNASQYEVRSEGVLNYESLVLVSDKNEDARYSIADFRMEVNVQNLEVISNDFSNFFIIGSADQALIGFYAGGGRFEGGGFLVDELRVFHRGSNKMIVHPVNSIRGEIVANGDVIAKNRPDNVDVEERFTGRLLFE